MRHGRSKFLVVCFSHFDDVLASYIKVQLDGEVSVEQQQLFSTTRMASASGAGLM